MASIQRSAGVPTTLPAAIPLRSAEGGTTLPAVITLRSVEVPTTLPASLTLGVEGFIALINFRSAEVLYELQPENTTGLQEDYFRTIDPKIRTSSLIPFGHSIAYAQNSLN